MLTVSSLDEFVQMVNVNWNSTKGIYKGFEGLNPRVLRIPQSVHRKQRRIILLYYPLSNNIGRFLSLA